MNTDSINTQCAVCPRPTFEQVRSFLRKHWQPKPIEPPTVDPDLEELTAVQRSAEVIRYSILSLELWLSPLGRLREWVRLNSKLCAILSVPALLVLPLITFILIQVTYWLALLVQMTGNLILFPLAALMALFAISAVVLIVRAIFINR